MSGPDVQSAASSSSLPPPLPPPPPPPPSPLLPLVLCHWATNTLSYLHRDKRRELVSDQTINTSHPLQEGKGVYINPMLNNWAQAGCTLRLNKNQCLMCGILGKGEVLKLRWISCEFADFHVLWWSLPGHHVESNQTVSHTKFVPWHQVWPDICMVTRVGCTGKIKPKSE